MVKFQYYEVSFATKKIVLKKNLLKKNRHVVKFKFVTWKFHILFIIYTVIGNLFFY